MWIDIVFSFNMQSEKCNQLNHWSFTQKRDEYISFGPILRQDWIQNNLFTRCSQAVWPLNVLPKLYKLQVQIFTICDVGCVLQTPICYATGNTDGVSKFSHFVCNSVHLITIWSCTQITSCSGY
jgi:hypothetical protein